MKKIMFSAIAMIAFMGSSMANTVEIEVELDGEFKKAQLNTCDILAATTYNGAKDLGMSDTAAYDASLAAYQSCLASDTPL